MASPTGLRPWFTKFGGTLHDKRWLPVVEDVYSWLYAQRAIPAQRGAAGARRAWSIPSRPPTYYGGAQARQNVEDHTLGYYQALIEGADAV